MSFHVIIIIILSRLQWTMARDSLQVRDFGPTDDGGNINAVCCKARREGTRGPASTRSGLPEKPCTRAGVFHPCPLAVNVHVHRVSQLLQVSNVADHHKDKSCSSIQTTKHL
jgi:hypothetical protein